MPELLDAAIQRPNFVTFILLLLAGLYICVSHPNLIKKLIGLYLVQNSVIFYFVTISAKEGATAPVLLDPTQPVQAESFVNPLPHVLTLTAIVVQVATLGVSLGIVSAINKRFGSFDEEAILEKLK